MEKLTIQAIPNQNFSCTLGGKLFDVSIQLGKSNSTLLSITVDGVTQFTGVLSVNKAQMMLPPRNVANGNLMWLCDDGASYPYYEQFGTTHNLYWWSN